MDTDRLRYFLVVNETGSIRKAAELLYISPAALSKALKQLESETGLTLLAPSGRGIAITEEGRELAQRAKPLLEGLLDLSRQIREGRDSSQSPTRSARIGSFEVFSTHFVRALLDNLPAETDLLLREVIPGEMERALIDREIDFGITYLPVAMAGVEHHQVTNIEMGIFGAGTRHQGLEFEELPFVVPVQPLVGSPNKVQGLDGWPDDRITRQIRYRVTLMESALEICRSGRGVAYLPTFIARLHNETAKAPYQLAPHKLPRGLGQQKQGVFISRRKGDSENDLFKKIAKCLRLTCK